MASSVSIVNFEQVNAGWAVTSYCLLYELQVTFYMRVTSCS